MIPSFFKSRKRHDKPPRSGCAVSIFVCAVRVFVCSVRVFVCAVSILFVLCRGGGRSTRLVRPFKKNVNFTIIGPTRTLKKKALIINKKIFGPTKVGVVGPAPPALLWAI